MASKDPSIPSVSHALKAVKYGSPSTSLEYCEVKTPEITSETQVLVKIHVAGVNPIEAKLRSGNITHLLKMPIIFGSDFSGVIVKKGAKVSSFEVGDEVFGKVKFFFGVVGTYSEYAVVDVTTNSIVKKPAHLSFIEAGVMGMAAITAYEAVVNKSRLNQLPKDTTLKIIIIGASGGVGTFAVQIAKALDIHVTAICSGKNAPIVQSLGADEIVDYTSPEALKSLANQEATFDFIVDCVGGDEYYKMLVATVKNGGSYVSAVGPVQHFGASKVGILQFLNIGKTIMFRSFFSHCKYVMVSGLSEKTLAEGLLPLIEKNSIKSIVLPEQVFDLKDGIKAHEAIESHRTVGKIGLKMVS
ncbi:chaperonin 10-like protein [Phycomyces nitens]|nr:chaperonin 10-like protein [Phycomyces nitens]